MDIDYVPREKHFYTCKDPAYNTWKSMLARCYRPADPGYDRYGGRGILVCNRWHTFDSFREDMGERPPGTCLDRINNDLGYEKSNCRWVTARQQANNRRNNIIVSHGGRTLTLKQWAECLGLSYATLKWRYANGKRGSDLLAPPHTPAEITHGEEIRRLRRSGMTYAAIADRLGIGHGTAVRASQKLSNN